MVCVLLFLQSVLQCQFLKFVKMLCFVNSSMHIQIIMCNKRQKPLHEAEVENDKFGVHFVGIYWPV